MNNQYMFRDLPPSRTIHDLMFEIYNAGLIDEIFKSKKASIKNNEIIIIYEKIKNLEKIIKNNQTIHTKESEKTKELQKIFPSEEELENLKNEKIKKENDFAKKNAEMLISTSTTLTDPNYRPDEEDIKLYLDYSNLLSSLSNDAKNTEILMNVRLGNIHSDIAELKFNYEKSLHEKQLNLLKQRLKEKISKVNETLSENNKIEISDDVDEMVNKYYIMTF